MTKKTTKKKICKKKRNNKRFRREFSSSVDGVARVAVVLFIAIQRVY